MTDIAGYVATALGPLHYRSSGTGEPVVLLPHSGRSSRMYRKLMPALARRYRVIAIDLPGSGESAPLPDGTSFQTIAAALAEALGTMRLGGINLYGIHTGNKLGAILAADPALGVRRFAFAGQSHSIVPDQALRNGIIRKVVAKIFPAPQSAGMTAVLDWTSALAWVQSYGLARDTLAEIGTDADFSAQLDEIVDELQGMRARKTLYQANFAYDLEADLRRIACPTLILEIATPQEDREVGRQGAALLDIIPRSRLITLEEPDGIGLTLEGRAEEVAAILGDFFA